MKIAENKNNLDTFVQAVLCGKIKLGAVLRQNELCEILNTSMSPLRELLVLLEELELIEVKPRAGFKVIYPDIDFMRENMQFRIIIETRAIETFIEEVTDGWLEDQILKHKKAISDLTNAENLTKINDYVLELDRNFHKTIVAALKNRAASKAHEYTQTKLRIARQVHRRIPPRKTNMLAMQDHLAILDSLLKRDLNDVHLALDAHFNQSIRNTLVGY